MRHQRTLDKCAGHCVIRPVGGVPQNASKGRQGLEVKRWLQPRQTVGMQCV